MEDVNNDRKCLFGQAVSKFSARHPGGSTLIESGGDVGDNAATMLFLSYHFGKDFDKIQQMAAAHGFVGVSKIKRTALHRELDDIFRSVAGEHAVHGSIYRTYCALLTMLFLFSLYTHCSSPSIQPWNSLLVVFCWFSYSFAVFHIRVKFPSDSLF